MAWLAKEYSYVTLDEDGQRMAIGILRSLRYGNKEEAWIFLDNWNAACPAHRIAADEVGLDPKTREDDVSTDRSALSAMPTFARAAPQGRDYRSGKPGEGSAISLPSDLDLAANLDRYWRGKGGEMGGSATARKLEKHGEDSGSELEFARKAFAFARQNRTQWFYQDPNQIVFHNYSPDSSEMVKMAVWDYSAGAMVTFYTVEPSKVGDVLKYLRSKGYKG